MKRSLLAGLAAGLMLAVGCRLVWVFLCGNLHPVIDQTVYRSAQPSTEQLERWVGQHGIRTVVNLRGRFTPYEHHDEELATVQRLGLTYHEFNLSALRLPYHHEILEVMAVLDASPKPLLFHCHSGGDRSGLVATLALLLYTDADVPTALGQLRLSYGHFPLSERRRSMSRFFRNYQRWLDKRALAHSPERLRTWVRDFYQYRLPERSGVNAQASNGGQPAVEIHSPLTAAARLEK